MSSAWPRLSRQGAVLWLAFALDFIGGEPPERLHPVCWMGKAVEVAEDNVPGRNGRPATQRAAGAAVAVGLPLATYASVRVALKLIPRKFRGTAEAGLLAAALAGRSLYDAAMAVDRTLAESEETGRAAVARMVGRDTESLDEDAIVRAAIESVAENANDGVIAPLFYALLGGAPMALAYKMVNTLDSMIAYRNERYRDFGWAAARLDDAAGFIPARLTALAVAGAARVAGGDAGGALSVWRRDGRRHDSPNAGVCEAAFAGALGVRLGGTDSYGGVQVEKPELGGGLRPPVPDDIVRAAQLMYTAAALFMAAGSAVRWLNSRSSCPGS